jgi:hypothetical protein
LRVSTTCAQDASGIGAITVSAMPSANASSSRAGLACQRFSVFAESAHSTSAMKMPARLVTRMFWNTGTSSRSTPYGPGNSVLPIRRTSGPTAINSAPSATSASASAGRLGHARRLARPSTPSATSAGTTSPGNR